VQNRRRPPPRPRLPVRVSGRGLAPAAPPAPAGAAATVCSSGRLTPPRLLYRPEPPPLRACPRAFSCRAWWWGGTRRIPPTVHGQGGSGGSTASLERSQRVRGQHGKHGAGQVNMRRRGRRNGRGGREERRATPTRVASPTCGKGLGGAPVSVGFCPAALAGASLSRLPPSGPSFDFLSRNPKSAKKSSVDGMLLGTFL